MQNTFAGHTISVASSSGIVVIDGTKASVAGASASLTVSKSGSALIVSGGGSSITLAPGEQTSFAGHTVSAALSSGIVDVDGMRTTASLAAASSPPTTGTSGSVITANFAAGSAGTKSINLSHKMADFGRGARRCADDVGRLAT